MGNTAKYKGGNTRIVIYIPFVSFITEKFKYRIYQAVIRNPALPFEYSFFFCLWYTRCFFPLQICHRKIKRNYPGNECFKQGDNLPYAKFLEHQVTFQTAIVTQKVCWQLLTMVNILIIQLHFLRQTATSRCGVLRMFQGLTASPSSGCCWWLGYTNRFLNVRGRIDGDSFPINIWQ